MIMRKYYLAIGAWILFLLVLIAVGAVITKLIYPSLAHFLIVEKGALNSFTNIAAKIAILLAIYFATILSFYFIFFKTQIGRKLKKWFVNINRLTFWPGK